MTWIEARLGFRPTLWASVFGLAAIAALLVLGIWQMERRAWKADLIAARQAQFAAPPVPLPADDRAVDYLWRRVSLSGSFLHERELYLAARSLRGNVGYHVLTPFQRDDGAVVLVNRGWVSQERKDPTRRTAAQDAGPTVVQGIVVSPGRKGAFTPENDPARNTWLWIDLPHIAQHLGLVLQPVVVDADATPNPGGFPIGGQTHLDLPNDHLQYALTWFALAFALAVIYVLWHRGRGSAPPR
ncbi:MAG: SURF1 family protein [Alphaproteobacteria bacterium]|nr:SURF1 family protein [Alphaproteobacteria bacterium]